MHNYETFNAHKSVAMTSLDTQISLLSLNKKGNVYLRNFFSHLGGPRLIF